MPEATLKEFLDDLLIPEGASDEFLEELRRNFQGNSGKIVEEFIGKNILVKLWRNT